MHFPQPVLVSNPTSLRPAGEIKPDSYSDARFNDALQYEKQGEIENAHAIYSDLFWNSNLTSDDASYFCMLTNQTKNPELTLRFMTACKAYGKAKANFLMGKIYLTGDGVEPCVKEAMLFLKKSVKMGFSDAQACLEELYLSGRGIKWDSSAALEFLEQAAANSNPAALYQLGLVYKNGRFVSPNSDRAFALLTKAADQHHASAAYLVAQLMMEKHQTPNRPLNALLENYHALAMHYYKIAADANHPQGAYQYAKIIKNDNTSEAYRSVIYYLKKAADAGYQKAQTILSHLPRYASRYYKKANALWNNRNFFNSNESQAIHLFEIAVTMGSAEAAYMLGLIIEGNSKKLFSTESLTKAIHYFELAARAHHAEAAYKLVHHYQQQNTREAFRSTLYFLTIAAKNGHTAAQEELSLIPEKAAGMFAQAELLWGSKNPTNDNEFQAIRLYKGAVAFGNLPAAVMLGMIYETKSMSKPSQNKNKEKALAYYKIAADHGYSGAAYAVASTYEERVIRTNSDTFVWREKANTYFKIAAKSEYPEALNYGQHEFRQLI